jgi:hypothetical protein
MIFVVIGIRLKELDSSVAQNCVPLVNFAWFTAVIHPFWKVGEFKYSIFCSGEMCIRFGQHAILGLT